MNMRHYLPIISVTECILAILILHTMSYHYIIGCIAICLFIIILNVVFGLSSLYAKKTREEKQ